MTAAGGAFLVSVRGPGRRADMGVMPQLWAVQAVGQESQSHCNSCCELRAIETAFAAGGF